MNVYKVTDTETPYSGGMALVAANNEEEALNVFRKNTDVSAWAGNIDKLEYTPVLLEDVVYNKENACLITEKWYYE